MQGSNANFGVPVRSAKIFRYPCNIVLVTRNACICEWVCVKVEYRLECLRLFPQRKWLIGYSIVCTHFISKKNSPGVTEGEHLCPMTISRKLHIFLIFNSCKHVNQLSILTNTQIISLLLLMDMKYLTIYPKNTRHSRCKLRTEKLGGWLLCPLYTRPPAPLSVSGRTLRV